MPSVIRGSDNFDTTGGNAVKAWANFNGTGTVAIRASFNVSSITDNGTGDYTVNFTTAMPDVNYAITFGNGDNTGNITQTSYVYSSATYLAGSSRFTTKNNGVGPYDPTIVTLAIFR